MRYDRAGGFAGLEAKGLNAALELPALGADVSLASRDIYRGTAVR